MSDVSGQLVIDDLPDDVEGAESLLTTHAEHKVEIDAQDVEFEAFEKKGEALIRDNHYASGEVGVIIDSSQLICIVLYIHSSL